MKLKYLILAFALIATSANYSMELDSEQECALKKLRNSPFGGIALIAAYGVNGATRTCGAKAIAILASLSKSAAEAIDDRVIW